MCSYALTPNMVKALFCIAFSLSIILPLVHHTNISLETVKGIEHF